LPLAKASGYKMLDMKRVSPSANAALFHQQNTEHYSQMMAGSENLPKA
jgi:hypothetical protein